MWPDNTDPHQCFFSFLFPSFLFILLPPVLLSHRPFSLSLSLRLLVKQHMPHWERGTTVVIPLDLVSHSTPKHGDRKGNYSLNSTPEL